jgi:putative transposase
MSFHEIDDVLWESIEHHLPPQKPHTGRPRSDLRKLMNGILYVVTTGCTWQDVPSKYGSKSTVHRFHLYLFISDNYEYHSIYLLRRFIVDSTLVACSKCITHFSL